MKESLITILIDNKMTFKEEKELIELKHKYAMEEIEAHKKAEIEIERLKHSNTLEAQRIKSAEIRKAIDRRENKQFAESYPR